VKLLYGKMLQRIHPSESVAKFNDAIITILDQTEECLPLL